MCVNMGWGYRSKQEKKKDKLLTMNPQEITYDMVSKKLKEVILSRGKKGVDRREQVRGPPCTSYDQFKQASKAGQTLNCPGHCWQIQSATISLSCFT